MSHSCYKASTFLFEASEDCIVSQTHLVQAFVYKQNQRNGTQLVKLPYKLETQCRRIFDSLYIDVAHDLSMFVGP